MVGRNCPADHASCLDDGYEGGDGHASSGFYERGVTCGDLLFETEKTRPDCLGCSHGRRRSRDAATIVSGCRSDSWYSAQASFGERQDMVACLCAVGRWLPPLAFANVVHPVPTAAR